MKRGELSMEVIIIAAIALLVLVILSVLILRSGEGTVKGTACESPSIRGECRGSAAECASDARIPSSNNCQDPSAVCCIPVIRES